MKRIAWLLLPIALTQIVLAAHVALIALTPSRCDRTAPTIITIGHALHVAGCRREQHR